MKKFVLFLVVCLIIAALGGAYYFFVYKNDENLKQKYSEVMTKYDQAANQNRQYQSDIEKLKEQISTTRAELDKCREDFIVMNNDKQLRWLEEINEWNGIVILNVKDEKEKYEVKEPALLKMDLFFWDVIGRIRRGDESPAPGNITKSYIYQFTKDNHTYTIEVLGDNLFKYENKYYECNGQPTILGEAFLPAAKYVKTDSVFNKVAGSFVITGKKQLRQPYLSPYRTKLIADSLQWMEDNGETRLLKKAPEAPGDLIEELTFYNHGTEIKVSIYPKYLNIKDGKTEYWYEDIKNMNVARRIMGNLTVK